MKKLFILITFIFTNIAFAEEITISSQPSEVDVYIKDFGGTVKQKIGKTPYKGNIQELAQSYAKSNFFLIVLEKENFHTQSIAISDLLKSDIKMQVNLEPIADYIKYKNIDLTITSLFEAQRLIRMNQYDEAINLLKKEEEKEKKLSVIPELIASAYYLKKDYKASLSYYQKAFKLNPENKDAFQIKMYLEKSLGSSDAKN